MKSFIAATALLSMAATSLAQYNITSKPFQLIADTHNETFNGTAFSSCHEGAGIEALCAGTPVSPVETYSTYNFNTSVYGGSEIGYITYELIGGNFEESQALSFNYYPSTNVALPLFGIAEYGGQSLAFDEYDRLYVPAYLDDTVVPPQYVNAVPTYHWFICETNYSGYVYSTLSWVVGDGKPQNPSCVETSVVRKYIE